MSQSTGGRKPVGTVGIVPVRRPADKVGPTGALSSALVRRDPPRSTIAMAYW
jgi:hypothetical protein